MAAVDENSERSPNQARNSTTPVSLSKSVSEVRNGCNTPAENVVSSNSEEFIFSVAAMVAAQPVPCSDLNVWGVLTALSDKARKRKQGINMLLTLDEHCIGRLVEYADFRIVSPAVSARHCKITRKRVATKDTEHESDNCFSVFLRDTSTNGTYLNWEKLSKIGSEVELSHGDIVSIAFPPHHELAFAFVFREVKVSSTLSPCRLLKRKPDEYPAETKRLKGIGIGSSDGPVSLDDFRSLQRSNTDLRKNLEDNVAIIESLRYDNRIANEKHEIEMRELKELTSKPYVDKLSELNHSLEEKDKELAEVKKLSAEQKHEMDSLNQRLSASAQSVFEAKEIIDCQKTSISQLKALINEERDQRREEREKASLDMKVALQKVQAEAAEEIKRASDCALKREKEQQDVINKLQEAEKERCILVENLRSKLEDTRQKLVNSDNKARQLESQISQELEANAINRKKFEDLENEKTKMKKELENEKQAAREEAWAKVSALELEISAATRDLAYERRRLKAARERIMLRETQLRAFYSTTEEIQVLFVKQQEQLKAMQRTLEDEENYEGTSMDVDLNPVDENENQSMAWNKIEPHGRGVTNRLQLGGPSNREKTESSSDETVGTEEHSHDAKALDNGDATQEVNFPGAFGSEINGCGTAPAFDDNAVGIGTELMPETEGVGTARIHETEHVSETESQGRNIDTAGEFVANSGESNPNSSARSQDHPIRDGPSSIRTTDLLGSEVAGSWACSTAPAVHGDSESSDSKDETGGDPIRFRDSCSLVAESHHEQAGDVGSSGSDTEECDEYDDDD